MTPTRILTAEDRKNRIYIAGPMTGLPGLNFDAFNAKAAELRARGWHVENPAEHGIQEGATWSDYLRHDMASLATALAANAQRLERCNSSSGGLASKGMLKIIGLLWIGLGGGILWRTQMNTKF